MNLRKFSFRSALQFRPVSSNHFSGVKASFKNRWIQLRAHRFQVRPEQFATAVGVLLVFLSVAWACLWFMRIIQTPFPPAVSGKGVVLYEAGSEEAVRALFGEKMFDASRLVLRGIVITGSEAGTNQGIALIEVDGKPAEAISIGELAPPGIRLEKIDPDGVIVTYQGKEIHLQQSFDNASSKAQ